MFRKTLYLIVVVSMLFSLVACAKKTTEVPATATPKPAAVEPTATPVPEPTATEAPPPAEAVVYKIGTNAEYPPFESVDDAGNVIGFDADMMDAIAEKAGFEYEFVNTRWDGIFVALQSGEFDAVISAATITDERAEIVDFSDPYFNAGQMIAVRIADKDTINTVADLDGLKVGVQLGTTGDMWLSDNTKAEVVRYDEITLAFQALANGDVDAVFNDGPTSSDIIQSNPELGATIVGDPITDEFYGIAVNKEKPELLDMINAGLAAVRADGTYDEIYDTWFGTPEVAVEPPPEEPSGEPKSVTMTFFEEPDTLNSMYSGMWFAALAIDLINPGFWYFDEKLEVSLEMAAEFPTKDNGLISEDGLTIEIPINPDANWSDGTPVTADDFVFTYDMILDSGNINVGSTWPYDSYLESVTAQDDKTLVIQFTESFAPWATTMFGFVLPKHILEPVYEAEGTIDDAEWNRNPTVVNGAYLLKEWEAGSHLIFEANPGYWRGKPMVDQINIMVVPDDESQMAAIKTGDTDIGIFLSYADIPDIEALGDVEIVTVLSGYNESWFFNLNTDETAADNGHVALQDVRVRQAIAYAVDFDAVCEELLYGGTYPPLTKWEETPYSYPDANPYTYDPDMAMALLDEAGWVDSNGDGTRDKDGVELVLRYSTTQGREVREQTQVVAQQNLADVGIGIEIMNNSYDTMWNSYGEDGPIATGQYDIAQWSDTSNFPDPSESQWLCSEIPSDESPEGSNWYGICDAELDAAVQAQEVEMDPNARIELFHEIGRIINEKVYWVGVWHDNDVWAINTRLMNAKISGADPFWNVYEWDVK
ncbi:MAG: transporter substrate-binding domain-containing protein [Anaerolineae bacterium]|nr:transporter substrate-binding domain-containing protein [Anaerolineae bacterium]